MKDDEPNVVSKVESPAQAQAWKTCELCVEGKLPVGCLVGKPAIQVDCYACHSTGRVTAETRQSVELNISIPSPERIWVKFYTSDGQYTIFTEPTDYYAIPPIEFVRADLARSTKEGMPLCTVHLRLDKSGTLECVYGNYCVACSLNERVELLNTLAGDEPPTHIDSVAFLRDLIAERDRLRASHAELVTALRYSAIQRHRVGSYHPGEFEDCVKVDCVAARAALNNAKKVK